MITRTFVQEIKHIITWFVSIYGQYGDLFFFSGGGFGHPVFSKPHFGHPVMKILAKTLVGEMKIEPKRNLPPKLH